MLLLISDNEDLIEKGKGNRDGLIQQIVTYVRDGHTITRKQWVRSEFADHAKKNEEEKKKTMLKEEEREKLAEKHKLEEENLKHRHGDERARKKQAKEEEKMFGRKGRDHKAVDPELDKYKKKLDKKKKENTKERKKEDEKKKQKERKSKKEAHSRYGQSDQTKADNKQEVKLMLNSK